MLSKKEFTNGADSGTVINLYRNTATALLGSTKELRYDKLEWSEAQFERLGEALCYCGALETLEVKEMDGLSDTAAAAVVAGLASCTSLKTLDLYDCSSLTALPDLSALTSLQTLDLYGCRSLTALPDLSALTSLQTLNLGAHVTADAAHPHGAARPVGVQRPQDAENGAARPVGAHAQTLRPPWLRLPHGAARPVLGALGLPTCLTPWEAGGFKAWDFITDGWPLDSTEIDLDARRRHSKWLSRCTSVQTLNLELLRIPHGSARPVGAHLAADAQPLWLQLPHGAARPIGAHLAADAQPLGGWLRTSSLTALPDLSALTSLQTLNLYRCDSLTALPDLSALAVAAEPLECESSRHCRLHLKVRRGRTAGARASHSHQVPARSTSAAHGPPRRGRPSERPRRHRRARHSCRARVRRHL